MASMLAGAAQSGRIERRALYSDVVERIRDMIIVGELPPGSRLNERVLCEQLGISRTPLREAFKVLARDGLLQLTPNRGAIVTRLTVKDVDEVFEVMAALEALAGELACTRISQDQFMLVRTLHFQMLQAYGEGNLPLYFRLNQRIHDTIMDASENSTLQNVYQALAGRIRRARYAANLSPERWRQAVAEHEAILAALDQRDGVRLATILRNHLHNTMQVVRDALLAQQREPKGTPPQ